MHVEQRADEGVQRHDLLARVRHLALVQQQRLLHELVRDRRETRLIGGLRGLQEEAHGGLGVAGGREVVEAVHEDVEDLLRREAGRYTQRNERADTSHRDRGAGEATETLTGDGAVGQLLALRLEDDLLLALEDALRQR